MAIVPKQAVIWILSVGGWTFPAHLRLRNPVKWAI